MDILSLLDQLEQLIAGGKKTILSGDKVLVDPQEVFNLIDQMRTIIPQEIRDGSNAKKIVSNPTPLPKTSASSARRRPKPCASSKKAVS